MTKLIECATLHQGGWEDIIQFLEGLGMVILVTRNAPELTKRVEVNQTASKTITIISAKNSYVNEEVAPSRLREDISGTISGMLAGDVYRTLMAAGYPVPGDKEWINECSTWKPRTRYK